MEYLDEARSLKELLGTEDNPFLNRPIAALDFAIQILSAIEAWGEAGIIHRDLSPGNVLVVPPGDDAKIIDFGICQVESGEGAMLTSVDEGLGTRNYTAPELEVGGAGTAEIRTDVYSAAKILWSAVMNQKAPAWQDPILRSTHTMESMLGSRELSNLHIVYLQEIFRNTVRKRASDRWTPAKARFNCQQIRAVIDDGFFALDVITGSPSFDYRSKRCFVCGLGNMNLAAGPELFNKNIDTDKSNYRVYECERCGYVGIFNLETARRHHREVNTLE